MTVVVVTPVQARTGGVLWADKIGLAFVFGKE